MVNHRDSLQPALLDRLRDDEPENQVEGSESRLVTKETLRQYILRDLEWLMNCEQPFGKDQIKPHPQVRDSVLNYGMPVFSGQTATSVDFNAICEQLKASILCFEPRLQPESLKVEIIGFDSLLDIHNVVALQVSALMWAQPYPVELLLKTSIDLETGQVSICDFRR